MPLFGLGDFLTGEEDGEEDMAVQQEGMMMRSIDRLPLHFDNDEIND